MKCYYGYRVRDSTLLTEAFKVDPIYLKHENQGQMPDFRVGLLVYGVIKKLTSVPVFYRRIKYRYEFGCV